MEGGIKAYQKVHGDSVAGRKVTVILKDTTGPVPEVAKRLAQELVVRDKVDIPASGSRPKRWRWPRWRTRPGSRWSS